MFIRHRQIRTSSSSRILYGIVKLCTLILLLAPYSRCIFSLDFGVAEMKPTRWRLADWRRLRGTRLGLGLGLTLVGLQDHRVTFGARPFASVAVVVGHVVPMFVPRAVAMSLSLRGVAREPGRGVGGLDCQDGQQGRGQEGRQRAGNERCGAPHGRVRPRPLVTSILVGVAGVWLAGVGGRGG